MFPRHPASAHCSFESATRRYSAVCSTRVHYVPDGKSTVFFTARVRNLPDLHFRVVVSGRKVLSVTQSGKTVPQTKILAAY